MAHKIHPCCDPCSPTAIWEGKPAGKVVMIDGIETYIALPGMQSSGGSPEKTEQAGPVSNVERVILFLTEAHSIYLPNAQILADAFASHLNCPTIMPDQFSKDIRVPKGIDPNFPDGSVKIQRMAPSPADDKDILSYNLGSQRESPGLTNAQSLINPPWWIEEQPGEFEEWKTRHQPNVTDPILERIILYIQTTYGEDVKIGCVGYCFGGRYVIRLMGSGVVDVGVINHPSFFTLEEVSKLGRGKMLAMYAAETDDILPPKKRRATEDILTKEGTTWMSTVFSGTEHGFSIRGDLRVKEVRIAEERAFFGAVMWFEDWL